MGLGNPGEEYENTPHNTGYDVVDLLMKSLEKEKVEFKETETKKVIYYMGRTKDRKIVLAKPITFMNKSGGAVKELIDGKKLNPASFILIHDDADISAGNLRISYGSSSGGHKGVEDVIKKIKTKNFYRFRVGIGEQKRPKKKTSQKNELSGYRKIKRKK